MPPRASIVQQYLADNYITQKQFDKLSDNHL
eukprot:SAG11_NODE_41708_length_190_cov_116.769231_1_plen_30_part_10